MHPQQSEGEPPFIAHQAPQVGTWSMRQVASQSQGMMATPMPGNTVPVPSQAGDSDLIEREWIDAAKQVISDNREDPFKLCSALSALKVQYMKKRYGEAIKIPE